LPELIKTAKQADISHHVKSGLLRVLVLQIGFGFSCSQLQTE